MKKKNKVLKKKMNFKTNIINKFKIYSKNYKTKCKNSKTKIT